MKKATPEQELRAEFAKFVDADPLAPATSVDRAVLQRVQKDLCPAPWKAYAKLTLVEVAAGLVTLTLCPQFGLGFGGHNPVLHGLHQAMPPAAFYLLCGALFVTFGAVIGGFILNRPEIRSIVHSSTFYFTGYSLLAYLVLATLGPEVLVVGSLAWIPGAILGNVLGYAAAIRLRHLLRTALSS